MGTQWIDARQAYDLIKDATGNRSPAISICSRAHAGLIQSKARLLIVGDSPDQRFEDVALPPKFWWAEGHEALVQDWNLGDFSTWESDDHFRAFGVAFDASGLLDMVAPDRKGALQSKLSVVTAPDWVSAMGARRFVYEKGGRNPQAAAAILMDHCRLGFVTARAAMMERLSNMAMHSSITAEREWDVPATFWTNMLAAHGSTKDWERGVFAIRPSGQGGMASITLTNVHFYRPSLDVFLPKQPEHLVPEPVQAVSTQSSAGRLRSEWWDDVICAVWSNLYPGDFRPKRSSEVTKFMLDWLAEKGILSSDSTLKPTARKIFDAYKKEDGNTPS